MSFFENTRRNQAMKKGRSNSGNTLLSIFKKAAKKVTSA